MKKSFKIDKMSIGLRFDRWIRSNIGKIPQSLIEKDLRKGNIKLNQKKVKSSTKVKVKDQVEIYNIEIKDKSSQRKKKIFTETRSLKTFGKMSIFCLFRHPFLLTEISGIV